HAYWEVETPQLCSESVVDAHLDPILAQSPHRHAAEQSSWYLQTSPELCMKRLLAEGADRIYQIGHVFRADEVGRIHNPEFTMLEWYANGTSLSDQMDFVEQLCIHLQAFYNENSPSTEFQRLTFEEAGQLVLGVSLLDCNPAQLEAVLKKFVPDLVINLPSEEQDRTELICQLLLTECIEPWLNSQGPTFLYNYPAWQAALARVHPKDPRVAERFELYWNGIELCNGYRELLDANVLQNRSRIQNQIRCRHGLPPLREPQRLIDAMQKGLPDCSGVALGVDRLVMVLLGLNEIREVIAFTAEDV
ncbi:MAG: EF-P lysine aminoacylase GenX, partial [Planctomycetaceae bacterium]|nr:EF-P lysine aminoacylase GenX [Planctomycetaceae bacterium]